MRVGIGRETEKFTLQKLIDSRLINSEGKNCSRLRYTLEFSKDYIRLIFLCWIPLRLMASAFFNSLLASGGRVVNHPPEDLRNYWIYDHEIFNRCQVPWEDTKSKKIVRHNSSGLEIMGQRSSKTFK